MAKLISLQGATAIIPSNSVVYKDIYPSFEAKINNSYTINGADINTGNVIRFSFGDGVNFIANGRGSWSGATTYGTWRKENVANESYTTLGNTITVQFISGDDLTNTDLIDLIVENATSIEGGIYEEETPQGTTYEVLYNDEVVGVVAPGEKLVVHCAEQIMEYDLVVRPELEPEPSGYTVTLTASDVSGFGIYEGRDASGTNIADCESGSSVTINTSSEYLYLNPGWYSYGEFEATGGVTVESTTSYPASAILKITGNGTIACHFSCLIEDTPITLADRTYKPVQDITYEDDLLVWDFDKGEFTSAKPLWIQQERKAIEYNHLVFSDGSELNTINQHRIFNVEKGMFTYPMTDDTPIGTTTFNDKGEYVTLVSKEVIKEEVNYYNIITDYHINLFAGSILTSCRLSNIYPIEDMKYVKDNREIIDYEEFNNIPIEYYYGLRLGEQPVDINRDGAVSFGDTSVEDYVKRLLANKKE